MAKVVAQEEAAIHAGAVDIQVEIVRDDLWPLQAMVGAFTYDEDEPIRCSVEDVRTIHDLTGRVLAAMEREETRDGE